MKRTHLLAAAAMLVAATACNGDKGTDSSGPTSKVEAVAPPEGGDWSQVVAATPAGGFQMGNPNAAVKLVEYGSLTCPHCREFDETGVQPLIDNYVKSGRVAYEFRNFIRDPYDLTASLITRCNGAKGFFPLTRAMYKDQPNWVAKLQTMSPEQQQAQTQLGPDRQFAEIAKAAGFQQWAAMRGLPSAKSAKCLTDEAEVNRLVQMTSDATTAIPNFPGTPTFTINGELVENAAVWKLLEPKIREALGE
ncbi:MAG TPA: thioredoxin domain-containing protein [Sphingomicrobium sp.]|jgi:protein-disulfide isomerase|nr:thioredoxin domain-containing protein [Sphingomicrobium sp.]